MILASENIAGNFKQPDIGIISLSDHAPISVSWNIQDTESNTWNWKLNNLLLEAPGITEKIEKETRDFFQTNKGSTKISLVWETFKVYISGVLIACNSVKQKVDNLI